MYERFNALASYALIITSGIRQWFGITFIWGTAYSASGASATGFQTIPSLKQYLKAAKNFKA